MGLRVESRQNDAGTAEPAVIWFGSRRVDVRGVADRWWGTGRRWWKVDTDEGQYVLRLDEASGDWELAAVVRS